MAVPTPEECERVSGTEDAVRVTLARGEHPLKVFERHKLL